MTSRGRRIAGRAALLLGSTALALLVAEGAYRWSLGGPAEQPRGDDGWRARYKRMNETIYRRSADPELVYEPRPKSVVEMEYGPAGFNSAGMRDDREYQQQPAGSTPRIALLGDSLVWGEFLSLDSSLGRQLEGTLAPGEQEVLNFGVSGYDTAQEARWYEKAVRPYQPEVLVLVYCMNDMMIMSGPYNRYANDEERRRKEEQDRMFDRVAPVRRETLDQVNRRDEEASIFRLLARGRSLFRRLAFDRRYVDEYTVVAEDEARVAATVEAIERLGAAAQGDEVRALLVISPVLESWDHYHWSDIHRQVGEAGRAAGFEVVDPLPDWRQRQDPSRLRFPGDNLHYNPRGTALLARTIAEALGRGEP